MSGARFTAWFSEDERTTIRRVAAHMRCSENFVIRTALRAVFFGESVPNHLIHRESCSLLADDPNIRRMGCTCDLGNASNINNVHGGAQR